MRARALARVLQQADGGAHAARASFLTSYR